MNNQSKKQKETEQKQKIHRRVYIRLIRRILYEFSIASKKSKDDLLTTQRIPAKRVAIYARVSTDILADFLIRAPKEVLRGVCHSPSQLDSKIYADEGISGTSWLTGTSFWQ